MNNGIFPQYADSVNALRPNIEVQCAPFYDDLMARYSEVGRHYHNTDHVIDMLRKVEDWNNPTHLDTTAHDIHVDSAKFAQLSLAIFYHDAVYIPGFEWNEHLSAAMAMNHLLLLGINNAVIEQIVNLIRLTKEHRPPHTAFLDEAGKMIIDADLVGLASINYERNSARIYKEFGYPSWDLWSEGRKKFLEGFLERDKIFYLQKPEVEEIARKNMQNELDSILSSDGEPSEVYLSYSAL